jgi:hypothetical protein
MLPTNPSVYPEFVADQVLTAHDLNELFGYLDEQGRMTRTNLIGIGIVCGLQVQTNAAKTEVTITKGCGVTSEGYLVTLPKRTDTKNNPMPEPAPNTTYTKFALYNQLQEKTYDKFVTGNPKTKKFDLWQLKQADLHPGDADIPPGFLDDKIVMLFVELLEVGNKHCDPNSCDDKGKHYEVNFLPMLVLKDDALTLIGASGTTITMDTFTGLKEIKLRRFDVPNTNPVSSEDIFDAYKSILSTTFIDDIETALGDAWTRFSAFMSPEFTSNPFTGLAGDFAFINDGSISTEQLKHIQYYYDLFSDFLLAYDEFRKTGMQVVSACCPDSGLFPRHLLLGEAVPLPGNTKSAFRHYFIYSPLFEQKNLLNELRSLFRRLVLLREKFLIPPVSSGPPTGSLDPNIRITPSKLNDIALSKKAIPYYYNVASGTAPLYNFWDFDKTHKGSALRNLSYHADQYGSEDYVLNPLKYDLEPYNFLRIEGIIGKPYASVLKNIKSQIKTNRLPVDVIALNTQNSKMFQGIGASNIDSFDLSGEIKNMDLMSILCHFQDLEAMYDSMKAEMLCTLCKELKYYYDLSFSFGTKTNPDNTSTQGVASKVGLFKYCSPGYQVRPRTFGQLIEKVYERVGDEDPVTIIAIVEALNFSELVGVMDTNADGQPDNLSITAAAFIGYIVALFEIPIYIIRLANTFTSNLKSFDVKEYCRIHKLLAEKANSLKFVFNMFTAGERQAIRTEGFAMMYAGTSSSFSTPPPPPAQPGGPQPGTSTAQPPPGIAHFNSGNYSMLSALALQPNNIGRVLLLIFLLEDFFDHLDVLIYNCKCSAFKALKAEYLKRVAYLTLLRQFGYFTKLHPGIQHKAGVTMGGTFIVVYHSRESEISSGTTKGKFTITGRVEDVSGAIIPGATISVENTSIATTTNADGQFILHVYELPVTLRVGMNGMDDKEVFVASEAPVQIVLGTTNETAPSQGAISEISEGVVIADFYLPYRCCSDCPPINYIVKDVKETPPSQGPLADAGPNQVITLVAGQPGSATLHGSGSAAPGNTIASFSWQKLNGPAQGQIVASTANSAQASVTNMVEGDYQFELTVKDNTGAVAKDTTWVSVLKAPAQNRAPQVNAGPDFTTPNLFLTLNGTATDPDGDTLTIVWSVAQGPNTPNIHSAGSLTTVVSGLVGGAYRFELKAIDPGGLTATDIVEVKVSPEGPPQTTRCLGFDIIVNFFNDIPGVDPVNFDGFRDFYKPYMEEIDPLFQSFGANGINIGSLPIGDQLDKFDNMTIPVRNAAGAVVNVSIEEALEKWCGELNRIVHLRVPPDNTGVVAAKNKFRVLSLTLYRVLAELSMYLVCIQREDYHNGRIKMAGVFRQIQSLPTVNSWQSMIAAGHATQPQVNVLKAIGNDMSVEITRVNANGEAALKVQYLTVLNDIIALINQI